MRFTTNLSFRLLISATLFSVLLLGGIGVAVAGGDLSTDSDSPDVALTHPDTIEPDSEFEITVETTMSAGTVLEVASEDIEVELANDEAVNTTENRIEFLDPAGADSSYTVTVDIVSGDVGDTAGITAWVNADDQTDADAEQSSEITLNGTPDDFEQKLIDRGLSGDAMDEMVAATAAENRADLNSIIVIDQAIGAYVSEPSAVEYGLLDVDTLIGAYAESADS